MRNKEAVLYVLDWCNKFVKYFNHLKAKFRSYIFQANQVHSKFFPRKIKRQKSSKFRSHILLQLEYIHKAEPVKFHLGPECCMPWRLEKAELSKVSPRTRMLYAMALEKFSETIGADIIVELGMQTKTWSNNNSSRENER